MIRTIRQFTADYPNITIFTASGVILALAIWVITSFGWSLFTLAIIGMITACAKGIEDSDDSEKNAERKQKRYTYD